MSANESGRGNQTPGTLSIWNGTFNDRIRGSLEKYPEEEGITPTESRVGNTQRMRLKFYDTSRGRSADSIERSLTNGDDCAEILTLLANVCGGINSLMAEVFEDHIRLHLFFYRRAPLPRTSLRKT